VVHADDGYHHYGHHPPPRPGPSLAAAKAVAAEAAGKVGYPMLWRQAALAVELCQRAAEMAGEVLPGSYRPGSRASTARR
jgi:hypothetical protein